MSVPPREDAAKACHPLHEALEPRLLLTTLHGGETFFYHNSQDQIVRVDLVGDLTDSVELFAYDDRFGGVVDLVGTYGYGLPPVEWPSGYGFGTEIIDGNKWVEYAAGGDDSDPVRGSRTELFAAYVANATEDTRLVLSTLDAKQPSGNNWMSNLTQFDSTPFANVWINNNGNYQPAPAGSGGVIVGAVASPTTGENADPIRHVAVQDTEYGVEFVPAMGVYPGYDLAGALNAGITVASGLMFNMITSLGQGGLGTNVHAVASFFDDAYVVDDAAFLAQLIGNGSVNLGIDVAGLAADSAGDAYTVNNGGESILYPDILGDDVRALASDGAGTFYAVDEATHSLIRPQLTAAPEVRGELLDTTVNTWRYEGVQCMDFDPISGVLYAISTTLTDTGDPPNPPDDTGPYLITVNTTNGACTQVALLEADGIVNPQTQFSAMAFAPDGTLYAVIAQTNRLVSIDTGTGAVTEIGPLGVDGIEGIDFIYDTGDTTGTLYGVTSTSLYTIDTGSGAATYSLGYAGLSGMGSLTYEADHPGLLFTTVQTDAGYVLAKITLGASLKSADYATSAGTWIAHLVDPAEPTFVYDNVTALDFDSGDTLYAVGEVLDLNPGDAPAAPAGRQLLTIDTTTGEVTRAALSGVADLSSIAFDAGDGLYGVYSGDSNLYTVNAGTGAATVVGALPTDGFVGIDFAQIDGGEAMYGVTSSDLYTIDKTTPGDSLLLGDTGRTDLTSLTFDAAQPGQLYSTGVDGAYQLVRVPLTSWLVYSTSGGDVTRLAPVMDSTDPAIGYTGIHALTFDALGQLWGVATAFSVDPLNTPDPAPAGPFLVTIDTFTGLATQVTPGTTLDVADLSTIAFDFDDVLWGVDPATNDLVTVDPATGVTTVVVTLDTPGIVGLDFDVWTGEMYGVDGAALYSIDPSTGVCTLMSDTGLTTMTGLSAVLAFDNWLYATALLDGEYHLISLELDGTGDNDMGRVIIGGTLAGTLQNPGGSIGVVETGWLWGKVDVRDNLGTFITRQGGGAMEEGLTTHSPYHWVEDEFGIPLGTETDSWIRAGGSIGMIDSRAGDFYAMVEALNNPDVPMPELVIEELEAYADSAAAYDYNWSQGELVDYTNDEMVDAQFLSHPSGSFTFIGATSTSGDADWYALPLMAGQTVTIDGFTDYAYFYDSDGRMLETYGFDVMPMWDGTLIYRPIEFTAPAADIYYLELHGIYALDVANGTAAALGGMTVQGNYKGELVWDLLDYWTTAPYDLPAIGVYNGGNLGAVRVTDGNYWTVARTFGEATSGGDIITYVADTVGPPVTGGYATNHVVSDGNVGLVRSLTGGLNAEVHTGWQPYEYNTNAYIQNVWTAGDLTAGTYLWATGSIGVVEVLGNVLMVDFRVNTDGLGPAGKLDLIDVGGNWGSLNPLEGIPVIAHGPGGDVGFIHVGGTVYGLGPGGYAALDPVPYTGTYKLYDDSGGVLSINAAEQTYMEGEEMQVFTPTLTYLMIGVEDTAYPSSGGAGGVLVSLTTDGITTFQADGTVQISDLAFTAGSGQVAPPEIRLTGGLVDVYYAHGDGINLFQNTTAGNLVSGDFTSPSGQAMPEIPGVLPGEEQTLTIGLKGSLGAQTGSTGAWLPGHDDAPTSAGTAAEPQYGWFHGTLNGINVAGTLDVLRVGGSLGDVRVSGGALRDVHVNSDGVTPVGAWHGVRGVVWSDDRIGVIRVGDGLKYHGMSDLPQAAILCSESIGQVLISGPYRRLNGNEYGLLEGAIIGHANDTLEEEDANGEIIQTPVDGITLIRGTNGARLESAWIGGTNLDDWIVFDSAVVETAGVNTVDFSGAGAIIYFSDISGLYIRNVITSANSEGIDLVTMFGNAPPANTHVIGQVVAGGPGLRHSTIDGRNGTIGTIRGEGGQADIWLNSILGSAGINTISARNIFDNDEYFGYGYGFHTTGLIGSITATNCFFSNTVYAGAVGPVNVGSHFRTNTFTVGGEIRSITVGGDFDRSVLVLTGPATADLRSLTVTGDISGIITSAARIGQIVSRQGAISADISTLADAPDGNVNLIQAANGITGSIDIHGSLSRLISGTHLGDNPEENNGLTQQFDILGDLGLLQAGSRNQVGHLYASVSVGGALQTINISGTVYGNVSVGRDVNQLTASGGLGGFLTVNGVPEQYGNVEILGDLQRFSIPDDRDIIANLSIGGSISNISLRGGSILGNIESRYGYIGTITLTNGDILGDVTANYFSRVQVTGGQVVGDITARNGGVQTLTLSNTVLRGGVWALNGTLGRVNLTAPTAGFWAGIAVADTATLFASAGIDNLTVNSEFAGEMISRRDAGTVRINGELTGNVWVETDFRSLTANTIDNATVRVGGELGTLSASLNSAIVSAAHGINRATVGNMTDSFVLAGLDVGPDYAIGGLDDVLHAADVGNFTIQRNGNMSGSVLAAGIQAASAADYLNAAGPKTQADGTSSINRLSATSDGTNFFYADTAIDARFTPAPGDHVEVFAPAPAIVPGPNTFGPLSGNQSLVVGNLTLTLSGAGIAEYTGPNLIEFEQTTNRSTLTIAYTGGAPIVLNVVGADDAPLSRLQINGNVQLGDSVFDGLVSTFNVGNPQLGATWDLPGGVSTATMDDAVSLTVNAGDIGRTWTVNGNYTAGAFNADEVGTLRVNGNFGATAGFWSAGTLNVQGNYTGLAQSLAGVNSVTVNGLFAGMLQVFSGDLRTFRSGPMTGIVNLDRQTLEPGGPLYGGGSVNSANIGGNFGSSPLTSFRAALGISSFTVTGDFTGLLASGLDMRTLRVNGEFSGRAWSGEDISNTSLGSMDEGFLAASLDLRTVNINGTMTDSWIFAGFDPGDAGYDAAHGGEDANLWVDAWTPPVWNTPENEDSVGGGTINSVRIRGDMTRSTISGAVGPGADGFVGTNDDGVLGTGYVNRVTVTGAINGSVLDFIGTPVPGESYGVFAASDEPNVRVFNRQPFAGNGNATAGSMDAAAGLLKVADVEVGESTIGIELNHPADVSTIGAASAELLVSPNSDFTDLDQTVVLVAVTTSTSGQLITLTAADTWVNLGYGDFFFQVTLMDTVLDRHANPLDGEYFYRFPTGDGSSGGDFVFAGLLTDAENDFPGRDLALATDGGTLALGTSFEMEGDIDVYHFTAAAGDFLAVQFVGLQRAKVAVFQLDDQGTALDTFDDFRELVARYEYKMVAPEPLFQAVELPDTGDYYVVVDTSTTYGDTGTYQLLLTLASSDTNLLADLGGSLPDDEQIGYVSDAVGDNRNELGANTPKQLVYLNFDGGMTTEYGECRNTLIEALDLDDIDPWLGAMENVLINGDGATVTGVVDNIMSIYMNTPASHPLGLLNVQRLDLTDPTDWAAYNAAAHGLFFTTVDPALVGLDPTVDFTTVFIGTADDRFFEVALLGIASDVDLTNMNKADNAIVFANNYAAVSTAETQEERLNDYSRLLANTAAHELGHDLGFNHQPTDYFSYYLWDDDPDNNPSTPDDSNTGVALMGYAPLDVAIAGLFELGTAYITAGEFPIGAIDTADLVMNWLGGPAMPIEDLAEGKTATQSSTAWGGDADRAVDGDTDGAFGNGSVTHTASEAEAWWEVDLGDVAYIESVRVWNRDVNPDRLDDFYVFVSETPFTSTDVALTLADPDVSSYYVDTPPSPDTEVFVGETGRYVRIQLTGTNYLSLAEVEVFGRNLAEPLTDVAEGALATQSSTAWGGDADRAVDGNTDGAYSNNSVTHTEMETTPWWQVDLGDSYYIDTIHVWNRDVFQNRLDDFYVFVSNTPFASDDLLTTLLSPAVSSYHVTTTPTPDLEVAIETTGQYVRIQLTDTEYLSLAEVEVFGRTL